MLIFKLLQIMKTKTIIITGIILCFIAGNISSQTLQETVSTKPIPFSDNFTNKFNGWCGQTNCIETSGCSYLGSNYSGLHFAFEPGGPIYIDLSGFKNKFSYTVKFTVVSLDERDKGKVTLSIGDAGSYSLVRNGDVSLTFVASKGTYRFQFNWELKSIIWAPIHVCNFSVTEAPAGGGQ